MTRSDYGSIAARALGVLFAVFGLLTIIDYAIHRQQAKDTLSQMGWNYGTLDDNQSQGSASTFFHDHYYVVTPTVSPIASTGFILIGIGFFVFSGLLGRLIGGTSKQNQCEQPGTGQPATRPVDKPEGSDKPQPEAEGRSL